MPNLDSLWHAWDLAVWLVPVLYVAGIATALDAVMKARTPEGAIAWVFALIAFPAVALPLYWIFGRFRFSDYKDALKDFDDTSGDLLADARAHAVGRIVRTPALAGLDDDNEASLGTSRPGEDSGQLVPASTPPGADARGAAGDGAAAAEDGASEGDDGAPHDRLDGDRIAFSTMATLPFTRGNDATLLVDGHATFEALTAAIDRAERYLLVQFYIVHDDAIGREVADRLIAAAQRGVRVYFLYDGIGSIKLPPAYTRRLRDAGIQTAAFTGPRNLLKKLRLNFRNHRKITVVDGREAFVGGLNLGDEYLGRDPDFGPWRDTHLHMRGPSVQGLQQSFLRDWYYASREGIDGLEWTPTLDAADKEALVLSSGPADQVETCGLLFAHLIESAQERCWIATPYFVPDGRVLGALQLAALRGVDVRVIVPKTSDSWMFKWVPFAYLDDVAEVGVKLFRHVPGFMHQKVMVIDETFAYVGTANFDNRSFRLNFESSVVVDDAAFAREVGAMLEADLGRSEPLTLADIEGKPWHFRLATQVTRLLAPIL